MERARLYAILYSSLCERSYTSVVKHLVETSFIESIFRV
jgi:hypothetical protein